MLTKLLHKFKKMTIRRRFTLLVISAVIVVMFFFGIIRTNNIIKNIQIDLTVKGKSSVELAALSLADPLWNFNDQGISDIAEAIFKDPAVASLTINDVKKGKVYNRQRLGSEYSPEKLIVIEQAIFHENKVIGSITLSLTNYYHESFIHNDLLTSAFNSLFLIVILWFLIDSVSLLVTRPIYELSEGVEDFTRGNLTRRIELSVDDEIGYLGKKFNLMAENLNSMLNELSEKNLLLEKEITERKLAQDSLSLAHAQLETKIEARTLELKSANQELQAINEELAHTVEMMKNMQRQLIEAEKMASLGSLVSGVAHEINTPVGVGVTAASHLNSLIVSFRELAGHGHLTRSALDEFLESSDEASRMVLYNLNRAAQLVRSFKQVSVDQSREVKRLFNLKEYLSDVVSSLQAEFKRTNLQISIDCPSELTLESYPGAFAQIATNLLMNSLIHAYDSGKSGKILFKVTRDEKMLILVYSDDGKGISSDDLPKIFDPFFTTRRGEGSTGLGLHIIYNIVTQKLQGSISCQSSLGQGVSFTLNLPL